MRTAFMGSAAFVGGAAFMVAMHGVEPVRGVMTEVMGVIAPERMTGTVREIEGIVRAPVTIGEGAIIVVVISVVIPGHESQVGTMIIARAGASREQKRRRGDSNKRC